MAKKHAQTPDRSDFDIVKIWPIFSLSMNLTQKSLQAPPKVACWFYQYFAIEADSESRPFSLWTLRQLSTKALVTDTSVLISASLCWIVCKTNMLQVTSLENPQSSRDTNKDAYSSHFLQYFLKTKLIPMSWVYVGRIMESSKFCSKTFGGYVAFSSLLSFTMKLKVILRKYF